MCPRCKCKTTYSYGDDDDMDFDTYLERCAACGAIFDIEQSLDDEDEE